MVEVEGRVCAANQDRAEFTPMNRAIDVLDTKVCERPLQIAVRRSTPPK